MTLVYLYEKFGNEDLSVNNDSLNVVTNQYVYLEICFVLFCLFIYLCNW